MRFSPHCVNHSNLWPRNWGLLPARCPLRCQTRPQQSYSALLMATRFSSGCERYGDPYSRWANISLDDFNLGIAPVQRTLCRQKINFGLAKAAHLIMTAEHSNNHTKAVIHLVLPNGSVVPQSGPPRSAATSLPLMQPTASGGVPLSRRVVLVDTGARYGRWSGGRIRWTRRS